MAYNKADIFEQAKQAVQKNKLIFIEEISAFLPCSRATFYYMFPDNSDELDALKELIGENRIVIKTSQRSKWYKSTAPALQLALHKLICTPEEHKRLSMNYTENINKNVELTEQEIQEQINTIDKLLNNGNNGKKPITKKVRASKATTKGQG